jgi:hypothetical protein
MCKRLQKNYTSAIAVASSAKALDKASLKNKKLIINKLNG